MKGGIGASSGKAIGRRIDVGRCGWIVDTVELVKEAGKDVAGKWRWILGLEVFAHRRDRGHFVGKYIDFHVGLDDGHFDIERSDFVGEALA